MNILDVFICLFDLSVLSYANNFFCAYFFHLNKCSSSSALKSLIAPQAIAFQVFCNLIVFGKYLVNFSSGVVYILLPNLQGIPFHKTINLGLAGSL